MHVFETFIFTFASRKIDCKRVQIKMDLGKAYNNPTFKLEIQ
jgi:hypothetical protein